MKEEEPKDWCREGNVWPQGPFRVPPRDGPSKYDLTSIEQYARVSAQAAEHLFDPRGRGTKKAAVAAAAGVSESQLSRFLNGSGQMLGFEQVARIAAAIGQQLGLNAWQWEGPPRIEQPRKVQQPQEVLEAQQQLDA